MSNKNTPKKNSRREFMKYDAIMGGTTLLAACAPQTVVVTQQVEKIITATPGPVVPTATPVPMATPLPSVAKLGGVLLAARTSDTTSLDPHTTPLLVNRQTCSLMYNQLAMVDAKLRVQPVPAEFWDISEQLPRGTSNKSNV